MELASIEKHMNVEFIQFMRPNGRKTMISIDVADDLTDHVRMIHAAHLHLTAEVLQTQEISLCIEDSERGDFACQVCSNGPEVPLAVDKLIRSFSVREYARWVMEKQCW